MAIRKKNKSAQKKPDDFYKAVFDLIETRGWFALTLPDIAKATGINLCELLQRYADKTDILRGFGRMLDEALAKYAEQNAASETDLLKDKLFDMVMCRFDALATYRAGVVRLLDELRAHPLSGSILCLETLCGFNRSMRLMLEMAGLSTTRPSAILAMMGLKIVYLSTLGTWKSDQSTDLSATMAVLDRGLGRLVKVLRAD